MDVQQLFEEHYEVLFRYLVKLTGDRDLAADAAQELFAGAAADQRTGLGHQAGGGGGVIGGLDAEAAGVDPAAVEIHVDKGPYPWKVQVKGMRQVVGDPTEVP